MIPLAALTEPHTMLDDLKLIELGHGVSAAYCGKLFADLGAGVIKVEPPSGDRLRACPPFAGDEPGPERSGLFAYVNTSKRGVTLDVTAARGRELFLELLRDADILIENHAPAWNEAHGLDYGSLAATYPKLIVASITPFGQDGPWRAYAGNEFIAQHTSGVAYHNGARARDLDAEPPFPLPGSMGDFAGGLAAAAATMCALFARDATGRGDHIDIAFQEVLAMHEQVDLSHVTHTGNVPSRSASANPPIAYIGQQPTADGYIDLIVRTEEHWRNLLAVLGNPEWAANELFVDMPSRSRYWDALEPFVQEETQKFQKEDLFRKSQANGVSAAAVYSIADAAESPHFAERGSFAEFEHPAIGRTRCPGSPAGFGVDAWRIRRPAPLLGEHNDEVYGALGHSKRELEKLRADGVI